MRIVTYNVNGLRARVQQHRNLKALLDSLDADIICIQETKLQRSELGGDVADADGYESFFSCCRKLRKGRTLGYSGVATFCKTLAANGAPEAMPIAADDGFTGLLHCPKGSLEGNVEGGAARVGSYEEVWYSSGMDMQELLRLDSEGRCLVTDHGSFVLFNVYGPCVDPSDPERIQFKLDFYSAMQRRWDALLQNGRCVVVVGDLNIAPKSVDSCRASSAAEFDASPVRMWFRSVVREGGGAFCDVFRHKHPNRREAYTCWCQASGAEDFNFGSRIDHILAAGPCSHQSAGGEGETDKDANVMLSPGEVGRVHGFGECDFTRCDIMTEYKRNSGDALPKWAGGRSVRIEGSDHAPVFAEVCSSENKAEVPPRPLHPLAARFMPEVRGRQQSIKHLFTRQVQETDSAGNASARVHLSGDTLTEDPAWPQPPLPMTERITGKQLASSSPSVCAGDLAQPAQLADTGDADRCQPANADSCEVPVALSCRQSQNGGSQSSMICDDEPMRLTANGEAWLSERGNDSVSVSRKEDRPTSSGNKSQLLFVTAAKRGGGAVQGLAGGRGKGKVGGRGGMGMVAPQKVQSSLRGFFFSAKAKQQPDAESSGGGMVSIEPGLEERPGLPSTSNQPCGRSGLVSAERLGGEDGSVPGPEGDSKPSLFQDLGNGSQSFGGLGSGMGEGRGDRGDETFMEEDEGRGLSQGVCVEGVLIEGETFLTHPNKEGALGEVPGELLGGRSDRGAGFRDGWDRIKKRMMDGPPLCKGHGEPCVARVVKKPGPTVGRGFYVCARAEGPSTNPEARCDHFAWATKGKKARVTSLSIHKQG